MYITEIRSKMDDVRNRIDHMDEEKYQIAFKYQYLTATEKSQVCGKYRPIGSNASPITLPFNLFQTDFIIFKITPNRKKGKTRYSILPASEDFDPWVRDVFEYFNKFPDSCPFIFSDKKMGTSEKYFMDKANEVFDGLDWMYSSYPKKSKKIDAREKNFTSDALRKLRLNDLVFNNNFNTLDLYRFSLYNDNSKLFKNQIKEIYKEDFDSYSDTELIIQASDYLIKFLKKNSSEKYLDIINPIHLYFLLWSYDKHVNDLLEYNENSISELSSILDKNENDIVSILQQISYYDPRNSDFKPILPFDHEIEIIYEMCNWFWNNRELAYELFKDYEYNLDFISQYPKNVFVNYLKPKTAKTFIEEGSIKYSSFKIRKRSSLLVKLAREYFIKHDLDGKLRCKICGYTKPDYISQEIVHIHHLEPLKDMNPNGTELDITDALAKIIPLCPTCHSLVHCKDNNKLEIEEIINRINLKTVPD